MNCKWWCDIKSVMWLNHFMISAYNIAKLESKPRAEIYRPNVGDLAQRAAPLEDREEQVGQILQKIREHVKKQHIVLLSPLYKNSEVVRIYDLFCFIIIHLTQSFFCFCLFPVVAQNKCSLILSLSLFLFLSLSLSLSLSASHSLSLSLSLWLFLSLSSSLSLMLCLFLSFSLSFSLSPSLFLFLFLSSFCITYIFQLYS